MCGLPLSGRSRRPIEKPLVLERRGAFFVNYRHGTRYGGGTITVGQMYVEYEVPADARRRDRPVVLLPGGCHTGATYDETPDGREGWRTHFLRHGFPVYLVEWVGRGASGFDPSAIHQAREERNPDLLPRFLHLSHEEVWTAFRFGPEPGVRVPRPALSAGGDRALLRPAHPQYRSRSARAGARDRRRAGGVAGAHRWGRGHRPLEGGERDAPGRGAPAGPVQGR